MFRLVLAFALVAVTLGGSQRPLVPMIDERIVGGEATTIEKYPFQLSLLSYSNHFCGASIISATKALTAAQCTHKRSPDQLSVRASSSYQNQGGQVVKVASICQHPYYNPTTMDNDVSVLRLASQIVLGPGAQPIHLHSRGQIVAVGGLATITGWGRLSSGGITSKQLQKVEVPKVSDFDCKRAHGSNAITNHMICFGYLLGEKDSCQGDYGGPLVVGRIQVGIASWGRGCAAKTYPGVYAAVATLRDHIDRC